MMDGVAQTVQWLGYGMDSIPAGAPHQTGSGARPASYPMGNGSNFPEAKAAGA